jgi:2,4-dienoyl-CoA reductase (NADPH2)
MTRSVNVSYPGSTLFPHLLSPIAVGPVNLRNRVVLLPTGTGYTNRGCVEPEDIAYHTRRAEGGVGLIITGGTAAVPSSQTRSRGFVEAYNPDVIPGFRRRSDAVHREGARLFGQLFDLGRNQAAEMMTAVPLGPSPFRSPGHRFAPMTMGEQDIAAWVEAFAAAAANLVKGGYDGIEVHAAHSYLLAQFLSPATNHRDDGYGRGHAGRARLLLEAVHAVRRAAGAKMVVGVRLSVDDETTGGTTLADCLETVEALEKQTDVDYLSLAVGVLGSYVKDSSATEGVALERIATVKAATRLPVIASQRIRRPEQAERALRLHQADLIGLARALIADPDWLAKARQGEPERIRLCLGDMQDCRVHLSGGLRCIANPSVGRETEIPDAGPPWIPGKRQTARHNRVVVIGGGPAGLECARRAAELGHAVVLYEQAAEVGGQLKLADQVASRRDVGDLVRYLAGELRFLGVTVHLSTPITAAEASALGADALLVIAAGATGGPLAGGLWPGFAEGARAGSPGPAARTARVWDVLTGSLQAEPGERVVLLDDGTGDWPMITALDLLAQQGCLVTAITPGASIFRSVPSESIAGVQARLRALSVRWMSGTLDLTLTTEGVRFRQLGTDELITVKADRVIAETGRVPLDELWRQLRDAGCDVAVLGDCLTPRTVGNAMGDAMSLARSVFRNEITGRSHMMGRTR